MHIILSITIFCFLSISAYAQESSFFKSVEFKHLSIKALPLWQDLLDQAQSDQDTYQTCEKDIRKCPSPLLMSWRTRVLAQKDTGTSVEQLQNINQYINKTFSRAKNTWNNEWLTPLQMSKQTGNSLSLAILKYLTLKEVGYRDDNLRILISHNSLKSTPHPLVIVRIEEDSYVLDEVYSHVMQTKKYNHYLPIYSFNASNLWTHTHPYKQGEK